MLEKSIYRQRRTTTTIIPLVIDMLIHKSTS